MDPDEQPRIHAKAVEVIAAEIDRETYRINEGRFAAVAKAIIKEFSHAGLLIVEADELP